MFFKTKFAFPALAFVSALLCGCSSSHEEVTEEKAPTEVQDSYTIFIRELSDEDYPNDPDLGYRSAAYHQISHDSLQLDKNEDGTFSFTFLPGNEQSDTVIMPAIDVNIYMADLPDHVRKDKYLTKISLVNQEWNRQQIRYDDGMDYWHVKGSGYDSEKLVRVDLARNCLNSGLWEIVMFERDSSGGTVPYYHGWFDFPMELYGELFTKNSGVEWGDYKEHLITYKPMELEPIEMKGLRKAVNEIPVEVVSLNDQYYPLTGARKKKKKNIMVPEEFSVINDFLTDETVFATFSVPGFYNQKDPRPTTLGQIKNFKRGKVQAVVVPGSSKKLMEITLEFANESGDAVGQLVFGGIDSALVPQLALIDHNKGFKMPMGIANHAFYETYERAGNNPVDKNPYYAVVIDQEGRWMDSHNLGIDGPLMFWDEEDASKLHIFILSFERHCFVGHYIVQPGQ